MRICEHLSISYLTGKKVKIDINKLTVIQGQLLYCNHSRTFQDFSILLKYFNMKIMESLLIAGNKLIINKADSSLPLELF